MSQFTRRSLWVIFDRPQILYYGNVAFWPVLSPEQQTRAAMLAHARVRSFGLEKAKPLEIIAFSCAARMEEGGQRPDEGPSVFDSINGGRALGPSRPAFRGHLRVRVFE